MAQAFVTVYDKSYVWHNYSDRTKSLKPLELIYNEPPKSDIWLDADESGVNAFCNSSIDDLKKFVNRLYNNRNWTTYQISYCKKQILEKNKEYSDENEDDEIPQNELIAYGKRVFCKPTKKILKPLPTSRKLFGYMRPANLYTGLSEYQDCISQLGYNILAKNYLTSENVA